MSDNMHTDICDRPMCQSGSTHYIYSLYKHLLYFFALFKSCLAVRGGHQGSGGVAKSDGVWLTRAHVWMFHLNHEAYRMQVKAKRKEIKNTEERGVTGGRGTPEGNMPRFLSTDTFRFYISDYLHEERFG